MAENPLGDTRLNPKAPKSEPPADKEPADDRTNRFIELWQRISNLGLGEPVLRASTHILMLIIVAIVIFAMRAFYTNVERANQADIRATAQAIAMPTINPNGEGALSVAAMPAYVPPETRFSDGIPRFALADTDIPSRERVEVVKYTVQSGDNIFDIAEKYNLEPETLLWGNYETLQDNPQFIAPGQELNILPTNGVYYQWNAGENLQKVAEFFGVTPDAIVEWPGNHLDTYEINVENPPIADGTWLIIPGGSREVRDWGPPVIPRTDPASAAYYGTGHCGEIYEGIIGTGGFIWPTTQTAISGYDYNPNVHPAIDIAGSEGNAVFASDGGVVVFAGESSFGYGNLIVIDHGTGWQSAYAHLQTVNVLCGQSVTQGTVIGTVGNTGNSYGAHLHFELRSDLYGKINPLDYLIAP
ncbi:MAG: peptidoglycan DD-metalloendopeptidase family protein [Anaerolineales bacterium]|nr:peptidoglycan DD-metalloendopeptidase family protein [Anaerolineales bacterium]